MQQLVLCSMHADGSKGHEETRTGVSESLAEAPGPGVRYPPLTRCSVEASCQAKHPRNTQNR